MALFAIGLKPVGSLHMWPIVRGSCLSIVGVWLTSGCVVSFDPSGLVGEFPRLVAMRTRVVADSSLAPTLGPVPFERRRAALLPGDLVELGALFVTDEGPVDLDETQAQWFLCRSHCTGRLPIDDLDAVPPCVADSNDEVCHAGYGSAPTVEIGYAEAEYGVQAWQRGLFVATGLPGESTTEECVRGAAVGADVDLLMCGLGRQSLSYGPSWALAQMYGDPDTLLPEFPEPLTQSVQPNAAPEIAEVWVRREGEDAVYEREPIAEPIVVETDSLVMIDAFIEPRDRQVFVAPGFAPGTWVGHRESYSSAVNFDHPGMQPVVIGPGEVDHDHLSAHQLRTPAEETIVTLYFSLGDSQGATTWFSIELDVREGGDE